MSANKNNNVYSSIYSIVMLIFLLSFVASRELSLSTITENFRWRKDLITVYENLRFTLGDQIFNNAIVGNDGWLFYTGELSVKDYQNTIPFSMKKLSNFQRTLDQLNESLEEKGIMLIVVVAPNKTTIYPQFVPDKIPVLGEMSRLDQFMAHMKDNGKTTVIDLRPTLLRASLSQDVYYRTDTHWNSLGAYYGYVEIMNALAVKYPKLRPRLLSDFEYKNVGYAQRDIPKIMGISNYEEEDWALIPKFEIEYGATNITLPVGPSYIRSVVNMDDDLPALLVYGDSFYGGLAQFIEPHFGEVTTIPFASGDNIWTLDWVQKEKPDVVIIEFVERYLDFSLSTLLY